MTISPVWRMQLIKAAEKILHTQGNYRGGNLEMAIVFDYTLPMEELKMLGSEILSILKSHSEVFKNVRLNVIKWTADGQTYRELSAAAKVQLGTVFEDYEVLSGIGEPQHRTIDELCRQLKFYYARSKLILILTNSMYGIQNPNEVQSSLQPFLYRKMLVVQERRMISGIELLQEIRKNG